MRTRTSTLAAGLAALLALSWMAPAGAAGGPPTITSLSPTPVPMDGTLTVTGTGCGASSPVSLRLFPTSGAVEYWDVNGTDTGWSAGAAGVFTVAVELWSRFPAGTKLGVAASCTATFSEAAMSNVPADGSYVAVSALSPTVDLVAPARAAYGSRPTIQVSTSGAAGTVRILLDGTMINEEQPGTHTVSLPATVSVGSHTLVAEFDPLDDTAPTVTDTADLVITKAPATVKLARIGTTPVRAGTRAKLVVTLSSLAPRVGTVVIKDGARKRAKVVLKPGDQGRKVVRVRLPNPGARKLTARFQGNASARPATSPTLRVNVLR